MLGLRLSVRFYCCSSAKRKGFSPELVFNLQQICNFLLIGEESRGRLKALLRLFHHGCCVMQKILDLRSFTNLVVVGLYDSTCGPSQDVLVARLCDSSIVGLSIAALLAFC
jgi:hypothetical protein